MTENKAYNVVYVGYSEKMLASLMESIAITTSRSILC